MQASRPGRGRPCCSPISRFAAWSTSRSSGPSARPGRPAFRRRRVREAACSTTDPRTRFSAVRGNSAHIGPAPLVANLEARPAVGTFDSRDRPAESCYAAVAGVAGCACWRPDPRRLASASGCRSHGGAGTSGDARVTAGPDDNQRSFRARRSAASPRRSTSQCAWTQTPRRPRCRSERRSSSGQRGVEGACSDPARSRLEQADGRRGGSSKR